MNSFDVVIIGAGSAGFSAAEAARACGASVCLIEKDKLGGECPNWACVPSKALLKCAKVYRSATHAGEFGIVVRRVEYRFDEIMAYKDRVVNRLTGGGEVGMRYEALAKQLGIEVVRGRAVFEDAKTVKILSSSLKRIQGKTFVIATGTSEFIPPIDGLQKTGFWTFKDVMKLKTAPKSLIVLGGGPVGVEFATFFGAFGIPTTLLHNGNSILNREDAEIAELATKALRNLGVEVLTNVQILKIGKKAKEKEVTIEIGGSVTPRNETRVAEHILLAAGKRPATDSLGLELLGVKIDEHGSIYTNDRQKSSVANVFAAGDIDGGLQFTHTAHHEGFVAGRNSALVALDKKRGFATRDLRVVPRVTFLEPEVASVGLTQFEVEKQHKEAIVGRFPTSGLGRSLTDTALEGLIKIVAHPQTREVLGGHMIGPSAGEVIHEIALAMNLHATIDNLGVMIHAFPTYSEAVAGAASNWVIE